MVLIPLQSAGKKKQNKSKRVIVACELPMKETCLMPTQTMLMPHWVFLGKQKTNKHHAVRHPVCLEHRCWSTHKDLWQSSVDATVFPNHFLKAKQRHIDCWVDKCHLSYVIYMTFKIVFKKNWAKVGFQMKTRPCRVGTSLLLMWHCSRQRESKNCISM